MNVKRQNKSFIIVLLHSFHFPSRAYYADLENALNCLISIEKESKNMVLDEFVFIIINIYFFTHLIHYIHTVSK